jgi:hypothetical protein
MELKALESCRPMVVASYPYHKAGALSGSCFSTMPAAPRYPHGHDRDGIIITSGRIVQELGDNWRETLCERSRDKADGQALRKRPPLAPHGMARGE